MMFLLELAFSLDLIVLAVGIGFLVWSYRNEGRGIALARVFGYIISILAILVLSCTIYYGVSYWSQGFFKSPVAPMQTLMQQNPMMQETLQK